jgi:7,8-dihydropterin-6-yl-methyl-4-(beta-D-ribofuranosyl)aminobenzene 5'-phosphate synthase
MKITIVYDNCRSKPGLRTGWGFSSLIEVDGVPPLLFDVGVDGAALLYNMKELGIDPKGIGIIVISHAHGDHTGGLASILEVNEDAEIYLPASFWGTIPRRKVTTVSTPVQISEAVCSTGELQGIEQSLVVKASKGIVVVAGCSHPGVEAILKAAAQYGKVYGIVGGLHGFYDFGQLDGLSLICPCHCTQHKSELKSLFAGQYVTCGAGLELNL